MLHIRELNVHIFGSDNYRKNWSISGEQTLALILTVEVICNVYSFGVSFCEMLGTEVCCTTFESRLQAFISVFILVVV